MKAWDTAFSGDTVKSAHGPKPKFGRSALRAKGDGACVLAGFFGAGERHGRAKFERPARRHTEQGLTFRAGGVPAVALIAGGIGFQIWALAKMLSMASLELRTHRRIVRIFLIGLFLVSLGVLLAIGGDAFNYSRKLFKPA